jgi:hypothetical protein
MDPRALINLLPASCPQAVRAEQRLASHGCAVASSISKTFRNLKHFAVA